MTYGIQFRAFLLFTGLLACVFPAMVNARSTTLVEPGPVTTSCTLSMDEMKSSIVEGAGKRGWTVVGMTPGNIELRYEKGNGKHVINVNVSYTPNSYNVTYKSSINLNYKVKDDGTRLIHPRPVGWMKNLSQDIASVANNRCFK